MTGENGAVIHRYYRRSWAETRGDQWDCWGSAVYLFETDESGVPVRQIEQYASGQTIRYGPENLADEYGFLSSEPLGLEEWGTFAITGAEFEVVWEKERP